MARFRPTASRVNGGRKLANVARGASQPTAHAPAAPLSGTFGGSAAGTRHFSCRGARLGHPPYRRPTRHGAGPRPWRHRRSPRHRHQPDDHRRQPDGRHQPDGHRRQPDGHRRQPDGHHQPDGRRPASRLAAHPADPVPAPDAGQPARHRPPTATRTQTPTAPRPLPAPTTRNPPPPPAPAPPFGPDPDRAPAHGLDPAPDPDRGVPFGARPPSPGSSSSRRVSEILLRASSTPSTFTRTTSPDLATSRGSETKFRDIADTCTRPS